MPVLQLTSLVPYFISGDGDSFISELQSAFDVAAVVPGGVHYVHYLQAHRRFGLRAVPPLCSEVFLPLVYFYSLLFLRCPAGFSLTD